MALKYWFPMTDGTLHNQGLSLDQFTSTNYSSSNEGKLGKCIKTNNNTIESGMTSTDWIGENGATLCGWFKFPESEIQSYIDNYSTTHTTMYGTLMGFNSYNGLALSWTATKPYTTFIVHSPVRNGNSLYIASYNLKSNNLMDKWVHIACIMDLPNKQISLYINGELIKTTITTDITTIPKYPFKMNMKQVYGGNGQTLSIPYYCNDIRVYDEPISPSEIKRISQGLVLHYSLSNRGFGNENLLSRYVAPGGGSPTSTATAGRTNYYGDYGIIIPAQESADTYFRLYLNQQLTQNETYTISCHVSGLLDGSYIRFPLFTQNNTSMGLLNINHNGICSLTFVMTYSTQTAVSVGNETVYTCFMDDNGRNYVSGQGAITLTKFKIEKGDTPTPWIPASTDPLYSKLELDNNIEYDLSGYQHNGTRSGVTPSSDAPRNFGSYSFNGTDSYVKCDTNAWMVQGAPEMTWNAWVYSDDWSKQTNLHIVSCTEVGGFNTESGASGYLRFPVHCYKSDGGTSYYYNNSGLKLADLTPGWHMITYVYTTTSQKVYLDREFYSTNNVTTYGIHFNINARLFLGCEASGASPAAPYFQGKMSDFRLWYTALTDADIKKLYDGGELE